MRRAEERDALSTVHRALRECGRIFRYAIITGRTERDVAADLRGAFAPAPNGHLASITEPAAVGELLRKLDTYKGNFFVSRALRIAPLVFVRAGELVRAEWTEIDFEAAEWRIPAAKMKMRNSISCRFPVKLWRFWRNCERCQAANGSFFTAGNRTNPGYTVTRLYGRYAVLDTPAENTHFTASAQWLQP